MRSTRLWVLAALPFALTACGGGDDASEGTTDDAAVVSTDSVATTTGAPMPGDTAASGAHSMGSAVTMNAVGTSGVTGEAQFMDQGPQTMVTVNLTAQGGSTHSGHIHTGTCANLGPVVVPLKDITLANGSGTSSTSVPVPMATVMNGQHVVSFHASSGESVVCGEIPAHQAGGSTGQAM